jgi:16S rRNA A1518/A1519 N6-dimethyltransferase RsmA/KsgA/DIM1 with predicted DNA glycosylase/AP lyase activity
MQSDDVRGGDIDGRVELVEGDVLESKHRFAPAVLAAIEEACGLQPSGRFRLVANLPYCVATPIISNLLATPRPFDTATVTVQREMGERMTATAGSHAYNALSVWVGAQCRGEIVRVLPPSVFWPRPKVDSAIVRLDLEPAQRGCVADLGRFHAFVRDIFCHRRKLLRGVLLRIAGGKQTEAARAAVDMETLQAVIANRYDVMARFAKSFKVVWRDEVAKLKEASAERTRVEAVKRALHQSASELREADKAQLKSVLDNNAVLAKIYAMREELAALWERSTTSSEQLLKDLQDWCARAEASGIRALEEFSVKLRSYALPQAA